MKKLLLLIVTLAAAAEIVSAQQVSVEHSQSRVIEPKQMVFIIPLTAEISPTAKRQEFSFVFDIKEDYGITSMGQLTFKHLDELKKRALYLACKETDTDLIVAATFNVKGSDKSRDNKVKVELRGYPAVYTNWKTMDISSGQGYDWVPSVYPEIFRGEDDESTTAVEVVKK